MFRDRATLWLQLRFAQTRSFCKNPTKNNSNGDNIESNVSSYHDAYKQLDKLDFSTAAKILFTDPPKKKKFGHFIERLCFSDRFPSGTALLSVYLVAQYSRYEMRRMEAELEQKKAVEDKKKREEEEKAKELELKEAEEKSKSNPELLEVKRRLGKLEVAINEIVVESKKQSGGTITKNPEDDDEKKHPAESEPGDTQSRSGSSRSAEKDHIGKPNSGEPTIGKTKTEGPSEDAKR